MVCIGLAIYGLISGHYGVALAVLAYFVAVLAPLAIVALVLKVKEKITCPKDHDKEKERPSEW